MKRRAIVKSKLSKLGLWLGNFPFRSLPPISTRETALLSARFVHRDGAAAVLTVVHFEQKLRVGVAAELQFNFENVGVQALPSSRVALRWWGFQNALLAEQAVLDLPELPPGEAATLHTSVPVPINSAIDVRIGFALVSTGSGAWQAADPTLVLERSISGQLVAGALPDYDYEEAYRHVDLQQDYWTIVGPATLAEFEELARGQCAQLVGLGLNARSRILDLGCGTGKLAGALAPILTPDGLYYGVDIAAPAITFCRERFPQPNFHFAKNEQTTIPIHGMEFDFIYLGSVFTHMFPADIVLMLDEIRRLVAPAASVVIDAFVSPEIADYVGSRVLVQLNEAWLLAQFQTHGFRHRELASFAGDEHCRRVVYHLTTP